MDVEIEGYDNAVSFYRNFTATMKDRFGTYLERLADSVVDEARNNLQNHGNISTGDLLSSIRILENVDGMNILVGSDLPYAGYIEYGRGPIDAVDKVLHWKDKSTGKDVFSRHSSAVEPMPFLEPAVIVKSKQFPEVFVEYESSAVQELL